MMGLQNTSQNCFINSVVQALRCSDVFRAFVDVQRSGCAHVMSSLFDKVENTPRADAGVLIQYMQQTGNAWQIEWGEQNDANDFVTLVMDTLDQESKSFSKIFNGENTVLFTCGTCEHRQCNRDTFCVLNVPCTSTSVGAMIERHMDPVRLDDYTCDRCKVKGTTLRTTAAVRLPLLLVVSLKRFAFDPETKCIKKVATKCNVEHELILGGRTYALKAAVIHRGSSPVFGHYICVSREGEGGLTVYDDETVRKGDVKDLEDAYMLFYEVKIHLRTKP